MSMKSIESQIQKVIDEGHGRTRHVIIQMRHRSANLEDLLSTTFQATRKRSLAVSARSVLPAKARYFRKDDNLTEATRKRQLRGASHSLAAQVRARSIERFAPVAYADSARQALDPLLDRAADKAKGTLILWAATSASMELSRDDLWRLRDLEGVEGVFVNRELRVPPVIETEPLVAESASAPASAWGIQEIGALASWGAFGARGQGTTVAVLDTGVDPDHPDLKGKINLWAEFDTRGARVQDSSPHDTREHGTHCAGTVAGGDAGGSWIGVAPEARIAGGLVLKGGSGTDAQILAGMQWAIDEGVDVMSLSLGGLSLGPYVDSTYTRTILTANRMGIPVVAAIGNFGYQTSGAPGSDFFTFAVGATAPGGRAAGFSGGRTQIIEESQWIPREHLPLLYSKPEISAPGVAVRSAVPGGGYESWNGTSMATPHVAGALALLLSATRIKSDISAAERALVLQDLLVGSVDEFGEAGQDHRFGFGQVNILRAIGEAKSRGF
ncbi:MAG: S8 family serine peptidase [Acidobacteriota bacterium]